MILPPHDKAEEETSLLGFLASTRHAPGLERAQWLRAFANLAEVPGFLETTQWLTIIFFNSSSRDLMPFLTCFSSYMHICRKCSVCALACANTHTLRSTHVHKKDLFFRKQCPALAVLKGQGLLWKGVGHMRRGDTGRCGAHSSNSKCHIVWPAVLRHCWVHSRHSQLWLTASLHRSLLFWRAIKWDHCVPWPSPGYPLPYHCLAISRV